MLVRRHGNPRPRGGDHRPRRRPASSPSFSCVDTGTHAPPRTTAHDAVPPSVMLVRRHGNPRPAADDRPRRRPPFPSFSCADTGIHAPAARTTAYGTIPPSVMLVRRHGNPRPPSRGRRPRRLLPSPSFSCVGTGIHAPAADDRLRVGGGLRPCASLARRTGWLESTRMAQKTIVPARRGATAIGKRR